MLSVTTSWAGGLVYRKRETVLETSVVRASYSLVVFHLRNTLFKKRAGNKIKILFYEIQQKTSHATVCKYPSSTAIHAKINIHIISIIYKLRVCHIQHLQKLLLPLRPP